MPHTSPVQLVAAEMIVRVAAQMLARVAAEIEVRVAAQITVLQLRSSCREPLQGLESDY